MAGGCWPALRGALGFAEGTGHPGGLKVVAEYFPAQERGFATGIYNLGASFGGMLGAAAGRSGAIWLWSWRAAFVVAGALALVWALAWLALPTARARRIRALGAEERAHIEAGQEAHLRAADDARPVRRSPSSASAISGASRCRASSPIRPGER